MPRFYFDICDHVHLIDREGTVLPDVKAARIEAISVAARLVLDNPEHFLVKPAWSVDVADAQRKRLFRVSFVMSEG